MPRRPRVFAEGATYHVYARITRREGIFVEPQEADAWLDAVRAAKLRDAFVVLAWCLMSNHFHLVLRTGAVPLWRTMRSIQGRFAVGFNRRHRLLGPVWQSRYKSKVVHEDLYVRQLLAYVHLNPVKAGLVKFPDEYRLSGHREILGTRAPLLVDVNEVLRLFGDTWRDARRGYERTIHVVLEGFRAGAAEAGSTAGGGWPVAEDEMLGPAAAAVDALGASPGPVRPPLDAETFLEHACRTLNCDRARLASRKQDEELTHAREAIVLVGTERYGLRLKALAEAIGKQPDAASRWITRGAARRSTDTSFAQLTARLDAALVLDETHNDQE